MKATEVNAVLERNNKSMKENGIRHRFILELVIDENDKIVHKRGTVLKDGSYHLRIKGLNGEIVMHQETTSLSNARKIAAKLLSKAGLIAKYKETILSK